MQILDTDLHGIIGMGAQLGIAQAKELVQLERNAHYMRYETFNRLTENIEEDNGLTSVPLVMKNEDGVTYTILSGNHRISAGISAGQTKFLVLVVETLEKARALATQLSHNAIVGEDDAAILATLYNEIEDVSLRMYSGLDDKSLDLLADNDIIGIGEESLNYQTITIAFLPHEAAKLTETWKEITSLYAQDDYWIARMDQNEEFMEAMDISGKSYNVLNIATQLELIIKVFMNHLTDMQEGYLDKDGNQKHKKRVPISTVFGTDSVPIRVARQLVSVIKKKGSAGEIDPNHPWELLLELIDDGKKTKK